MNKFKRGAKLNPRNLERGTTCINYIYRSAIKIQKYMINNLFNNIRKKRKNDKNITISLTNMNTTTINQHIQIIGKFNNHFLSIDGKLGKGTTILRTELDYSLIKSREPLLNIFLILYIT